jgi:hypothetical protein
LPKPQLILDYASPRPRSRLRLPVESRIEITSDQDSTTITETLQSRGRAIGAIIFAVFVLIILLGTIVSEVMEWRTHRAQDPTVAVLLSMLWGLEAALGIIVLDQTYRRTVVRVHDGELTLVFSALVSPVRRHCWGVNELGELQIVSTQSGPGVIPLAELQIRPGPDIWIHLFTDHHETEVRQITAVITRALKGEHDLPVATPAVIAGPDGGSVHHLAQTQRTAREAAERARQLRQSERGGG